MLCDEFHSLQLWSNKSQLIKFYYLVEKAYNRAGVTTSLYRQRVVVITQAAACG